jgi:glycosyltransferase involved in cell wall biosynthesis
MQRAIDAVRAQTYRSFELIIQDGGSTDGSLDYLESIKDLPRIEIDSRPDAGIGQAYNRGLQRTQGELVCFLACDEFLLPKSLERLVKLYRRSPDAATIYGRVRMVDEQYKPISTFIPQPFSLLEFMHCALFPTTAGILNRAVIGDDLYYDETLKTCPDYDFWMRLGLRFAPNQFIASQEVFVEAMATRASMSYRAEAFEQFCRDKISVLNRFLDRQPPDPMIEKLRRTASAGILTWAAEMTFGLGAPAADWQRLARRAEKLHPDSKRLKLLYAIAEMQSGSRPESLAS